MPHLTNKEITFILKDAQSRTKSVTSPREHSEMRYVLSCYYWQYGSAELAQYANILLETINKEPLFQFLKSFDPKITKTLNKEQMLGLVKKMNKVKVRKWMKEEIIPTMEMSIVVFEAVFAISRNHRRRLQETEGVLPVARWGNNKYGQYPVLSMKSVLALLKAMPEILEDIRVFADEKLAKEMAREAARKERQLSAKPQFEEIFHSLDPKYKSIKDDNYLKILIAREDYLDAIKQVQNLLRESDKVEAKKNNVQFLDFQKRQAIADKSKSLSPNNPGVTRLLQWLNEEDLDLFVVTKDVVSYNPKILKDDALHQICSLILESKSLGAPNQKRWKVQGNIRQQVNNLIEDLEDAIYSHPLFSAPIEDFAETISIADVESTALPQHLVTPIS